MRSLAKKMVSRRDAKALRREEKKVIKRMMVRCRDAEMRR